MKPHPRITLKELVRFLKRMGYSKREALAQIAELARRKSKKL